MSSRAIGGLRGVARVLLPAIALAMPAMADARAEAPAISEARAQEIAREAAGCKAPDACVLRGGLREGKWVFVVSFVHSRDAEGKPRFMPGGFVGVTVSRDGRVVDLMPGA